MSRREALRFPPRRLAGLSDARLLWLRPLWFATLLAAIVLDLTGAVFVYRDAYERDPIFARYGLNSVIENDGSVTFERVFNDPSAPPIDAQSRIVAINGSIVRRDTPIWTLSERLDRPAGKAVHLTFADPAGAKSVYSVVPRKIPRPEGRVAAAIPRDMRIGVRLAMSLLTCLGLVACAAMLFLRRTRDPVALLFSFSFLLFAGTVDPPLNMWLAAGFGELYDFISTAGWICLVIGIAAFPDGRFTPSWVRWIIVATPLAAIALTVDSVPIVLQVIIAFVLPLFLLASQAIKFRRLETGIERQQIKWAAFGFATGLVLLTIAFFLVAWQPATNEFTPIYGLIILALFDAGFLAMVIGLLISLIRFRLWEADQVISRSAVSAAVTVLVGVIWTLSTDLVRSTVELTLGKESATIATAASAVLAAGIFAPTQAWALRWTKRRFNAENDRIRNLIARLAAWRASETPEEIGMRSLSALAAAVHCSSAAILLDTPRGRSLVASRDLERPERLTDLSVKDSREGRFALTVPLEDEDGPIGELLLGARSDYNRYNANQTDAVRRVAEPLAEALRAAVKRAHHSDSMQRLIGSVEERLARLEGSGGGSLSPA